MQNTLTIFQDRKEELEIYYTVILDLDGGFLTLETANNSRFLKILKSNYILMLYNLVEACIVSGMLEIYESLKNESCTYLEVTKEIQDMWRKHQISQVYGPVTAQITYQNRVKRIVDDITQKNPLVLTRDVLRISGNLDAKKIKEICDYHKIRYVATDRQAVLLEVKNKRNDLAHGDVSFSDCARDLTMSDLENIKIAVTDFIQGILTGMEKYYNEKGYLATS
ncbi:MAG: MAE_28990/MAE_18760 family HEPN-like nuclease [Oscillospiraceae bacterium]|nr:MAE_28990/MAE_18760 family HEPN-like nuclease [Oscillospiraceae bacterium]